MSTRIQQYTNVSGFTFSYRLVSPLLIIKMRQSNSPPTPPLQQVKNADGSTRDEPNPDATEYQATLSKYEQDMQMLIRKSVFRMAVIPWQWTDEQRERIAEIREIMGDVVADETDLEIFIGYEALVEISDIREFMQAATRGGPTDPKSPNGLTLTQSE